MNLAKKKTLAVNTLGAGRERIVFIKSRLEEIKDALSKQDIRNLQKEGAIVIKEIRGRKKVEKRKRKRSFGKIKKKVNKRKREYIAMTRKLRKYIAELKKKGELSREEVIDIRKKIRNRFFKSKLNLREFIKNLKK